MAEEIKVFITGDYLMVPGYQKKFLDLVNLKKPGIIIKFSKELAEFNPTSVESIVAIALDDIIKRLIKGLLEAGLIEWKKQDGLFNEIFDNPDVYIADLIGLRALEEVIGQIKYFLEGFNFDFWDLREPGVLELQSKLDGI